jgi:hypothetical protein
VCVVYKLCVFYVCMCVSYMNCVHMYVCMRVCMYVCMHVRVYVCLHVCMCILHQL